MVAIIAILVAIAIPQFSNFRMKGFKTELDSDLQNAFTAAESYLTDHPAVTIDLASAQFGGYIKSPNVVWDSSDLTIGSGNIKMYSIPLRDSHKYNRAMVTYNSIYYFVTPP